MAESQDLPVSELHYHPFFSRSPRAQLLTHVQSNQASITPSLKAFEENLSRLANKPGVVATVILDAHNGSILKKASMSSSIPIFSTPQLQQASNDEADTSPTHDGLDDFSLMVWNFMKGATSLIHHLDPEVCGISDDL